jgi:signal transduction histidine kinase/CheY-like chemotaxis protein
MRNPLSALIGCADEITTSLNTYRNTLQTPIPNGTTPDPTDTPPPTHLLDEAIEAADTIIYCAMHQKRIIDDILTLSRLDSNLLTISPEPSSPLALIQGALKMFEAESKRASIALSLAEHASLQELDVRWTLLDPSRVLQVLINLLTNAIKFTRTEPRREVAVHVGASRRRPSEENAWGVEYVAKSAENAEYTPRSEGAVGGEELFLTITVVDTGRGLTAPETKKLFRLFAQASPKTYTKYGGSGLGLFISRQLVEMQGGEIGVRSESGCGSTFQFYIQTRRAERPEDGEARAVMDFQLLAREDALREACADDLPGLRETVVEQTHVAPVGRQLHILVVEDNLVNQKVVAKQLRKEGHIVSVANHGGEALEFIRRSMFWRAGDGGEDGVGERESLSVVLLDLEMPVMDGITCVKRIRELQNEGRIAGHVPVIAVTANAREDQISSSLDAGMVSFLSSLILNRQGELHNLLAWENKTDYMLGRRYNETISH